MVVVVEEKMGVACKGPYTLYCREEEVVEGGGVGIIYISLYIIYM